MSIPPITILVFSVLIAMAVILYVIISSRKQKIKKPDTTNRPVQRKKFPNWAIALIVTVATLLLYFYIEITEPVKKLFKEEVEKTTSEPQTSRPSLKIVNYDWIDEEGDYNYVRGSVKNTSNKTISYFEVVADYLNGIGNIVDSDYTNDGLELQPGAERQFEIMHRDNYAYS